MNDNKVTDINYNELKFLDKLNINLANNPISKEKIDKIFKTNKRIKVKTDNPDNLDGEENEAAKKNGNNICKNINASFNFWYLIILFLIIICTIITIFFIIKIRKNKKIIA